MTSCTSDIIQTTTEKRETQLNTLVGMYDILSSEDKMRFLDIILKKDI